MSVYTTNTEVVREYNTRRNRVAKWIDHHENIPFASPNIPPSILSDFIPGTPVSEYSSKSVPPRLMLRYFDGRPDQAIPNPQRDHRRKKKHTSDRDRSRSLTGRSRLGMAEELGSSMPEHIQIFPTGAHQPALSREASSHHTRRTDRSRHSSSHNSHHRSRSLPREALLPDPYGAPMPVLPPAQQAQPPYYDSRYAAPHPQHEPSRHHSFSHAQKTSYVPAPIYKSGHQPPLHYVPNYGPDGVVYSHSQPVPPQQPVPYYGQPNPQSSIQAPPVVEEITKVKHHRHRSHHHSSSKHNRHEGTGQASGDESDKTYYVFPSSKQTTQVTKADDYGHHSSRPPKSSHKSSMSTGATIYAPPSKAATKSPVRPAFPAGKKPALLQRLLTGFTSRLSFSSHGSSMTMVPHTADILPPPQESSRKKTKRPRAYSEPQR
ncbi:hypothetical protein CYLTODRAFT_487551 [Cylindrobasidium torrendii FP15055 ss-10]|uniref:Uncharacterized protein n=1 Tax=Cylindrobasidium torrendii FP15055 ss-10 TaxID=1314674 RepID=A0A0D7BLM7_9AGAR|nr:hypothetical protein CYLTODRAFT_487551 [Cylindrobasidium torrendii FP15055 ss-10]